MIFLHPAPYLAPEVEVVSIHVEEGFLASGGFDVGDWEEGDEDYGGDAN